MPLPLKFHSANLENILSCVKRLADAGLNMIGMPHMSGQTQRENLLALVSAYAQATGASWSKISNRFYGNTVFFDKLRDGEQSIALDKFDEVVEKFRRNWPLGAKWPKLRPAVIRRHVKEKNPQPTARAS